jgi:hypothetical protein
VLLVCEFGDHGSVIALARRDIATDATEVVFGPIGSSEQLLIHALHAPSGRLFFEHRSASNESVLYLSDPGAAPRALAEHGSGSLGVVVAADGERVSVRRSTDSFELLDARDEWTPVPLPTDADPFAFVKSAQAEGVFFGSGDDPTAFWLPRGETAPQVIEASHDFSALDVFPEHARALGTSSTGAHFMLDIVSGAPTHAPIALPADFHAWSQLSPDGRFAVGLLSAPWRSFVLDLEGELPTWTLPHDAAETAFDRLNRYALLSSTVNGVEYDFYVLPLHDPESEAQVVSTTQSTSAFWVD